MDKRLQSRGNTLKITAVIGLALVLFSCSGRTDRTRIGLKGDVKSYREEVFKAEQRNGQWEPDAAESYGHTRTLFDEKGRCLEVNHYAANMELSAKQVPVYRNGKPVEEMYYNGRDELVSTQKMDNISDQEVEWETVDSTGKVLVRGKTMKEKGRLKQRTYTRLTGDETGKTFIVVWEYDRDGNLVSRTESSESGGVVDRQKFEYLEFDGQGNWTRRLVYHNSGEPQRIAVREIEYY